MKKILLLSLLVTCSSGFAGSFEDMQKLDKEIKNLKSELNLVYKKVYSQTEAKEELQAAQKSWLKFKELQCDDFVVADTLGSPATVIYDLTCQSMLYKQRINFLREMFNL